MAKPLRLPLPGLLALGLLLLTAAVTRADDPVRVGSRHPVGWDRVPHPALAAPILRADGTVLVPTSLRIVPTLPEPGPVADDGAIELDAAHLPPLLRSAAPDAAATVSPNVRANDTSADPAGSTQSETTIAALGNNVAAGWNDGKNFGVSPGNTGYAYSTDGGLTWTDGGVLPVPVGTALHEGDPVLTNDNAGNFYFADLYSPDNNVTSAVAVCRGAFGPGLTWNMPVIVASTLTDFLDKEWIAADKVGGNVYCTYTRFLAAGGNQIEFSRSTDNGATWSVPTPLTSPASESVQGSRVAVGPSGEIQVIYFVYDFSTGNNYMRARRSTTAGVSWGPEVTLPTGPSGIISNYGSGPAGFNRAGGIGFPSLVIDNTGGINNGRVYATWEETFNFYYDPLGSLGPVAEVEGNNTSATATPITIGQSVTGNLASTSDQDWFSFTGTAGQSVILYLTPGAPAGDGFLRLFCGGGATPNRAMLSYIGFGTGLVVYTLPSTGTYYFRVLANTTSLGNYTVYTGFDSPDPGDEVGRDTRDAVLQSSMDGVTWNARKVVNDDPPRYDNAFPEVAVDALGLVYVDWYDHRNDASCGIGTDIYYARSGDAGVTFAPSVQVNDGGAVNWNNVASNLAPNMGDYSALVADGCAVYANFADGRQGTPDSWVANINDCATPTQIALIRADASPDRVSLRWFSPGGSDLVATVYRAETGGAWTPLAQVLPDGEGTLFYEDRTVVAGGHFGYRLGITTTAGERFYGETWLDVPKQLDFALRGTFPNPAPGDLNVSFSLPGAGAATLELFDVTGRLVDRRSVAGEGAHVVRMSDRAGLRAGIYLVKLSLGARSLTARAVVVR